MRRVSASRVYTSTTEFHTNSIVELCGVYALNHYPIDGETPMTEWLGGIIVLTTATHIPDGTTSVADIYALQQSHDKPSNTRMRAWHISNADIINGCLTQQSRITPLTDE